MYIFGTTLVDEQIYLLTTYIHICINTEEEKEDKSEEEKAVDEKEVV